MDIVRIEYNDGLTKPLERYAADAPKMLNGILKIAGYKYRVYIRKNYLSGQMLYSRPNIGPLWMSMLVSKSRYFANSVTIGAKKVSITTDMGAFKVRRSTNDAVKLANIYEHDGGYTIKPTKAKVLIYKLPDGSWRRSKEVRGRQRPFMSDSAKTFNWDKALDEGTERVVREENKKLGFGGT